MIVKLLTLFLLFNTTLGTFINSSLLFTSFEKNYYEEKLKIEGFIPRTINGTIYRNGFGKFEGNGFKLNHLFDSLSLLLKFEIKDSNIYFNARILDSIYYNDSLKGIPLYRTLGGTTPGMNEKQSLETKMHFMHDNMNANIIMMRDNLFAISDLAGDILIDQETLKFESKYKFKNDEKNNFISCAHPEKWVANRDIVFNYETDLENMIYKFYYINTSISTKGDLEKHYFYDIPTKNFSYIHSFSVTKHYIIFIEYPFFWNIKEIIDSVVILPSLKWIPEMKTKIHIIDLNNINSELITIETKAFFSFHHINAFDIYNKVNNELNVSNIFLELITYEDASIFENFYMSNLLNVSENGLKGGNYSKIIINLDRKHKLTYFEMFTHKINNEMIEMPTVNQKYKGQFSTFFYSFTESGKIIKVNTITGFVQEWYKKYHIPSEPIFISNTDLSEDDGFIVSVVLDSRSEKSYLLILNAIDMKEMAIGHISTHIPLTCHGFYKHN
jgi:carotenoid cleavage dioxygenase-like enzyme